METAFGVTPRRISGRSKYDVGTEMELKERQIKESLSNNCQQRIESLKILPVNCLTSSCPKLKDVFYNLLRSLRYDSASRYGVIYAVLIRTILQGISSLRCR